MSVKSKKSEKRFTDEVLGSDAQSGKQARREPEQTARRLAEEEVVDQAQTSRRVGARRRGGPRTAIGKARTKYNAMKFGAYSRQVLLKGESRRDFNELLRDLYECFQPVGAFQMALIGLLAVKMWRRLRLIRVGNAKIRKTTKYIVQKQDQRNANDVDGFLSVQINLRGLMAVTANPVVLGECLELLRQLRDSISSYGFDQASDNQILTRLYGQIRPASGRTLADQYVDCSKLASIDTAVGPENNTSGEDRKIAFLDLVDDELSRLKQIQQRQLRMESERSQIASVCGIVPDTDRMDRLSALDSHLARESDRIIDQFLRVQRIRRGEVVTPTLSVRHSL